MSVAAPVAIAPAAVRAEGLRKSYGKVLAVDGVSFAVGAGEIFGLLGPNGAGKSTTLALLAGLLAPDAGTAEIEGQSDPTRPEVRRRLGVAPQALALYEELTGEENLRFFGRLYGLAGARLRERVAWGLELSGLADRRRDRVEAYSGGMKRRLNLACALVHDPRVLFLDEPTAGVDPQSRHLLFERIEELHREGRTVLYTTHYMEEAQRLCDRVAILDHGRILALDTVDNLIAAHGGASVVQAQFAAAPADPQALGGVLDGRALRVDTDRPLETLARIAAAGVALERLSLERADLETVFLNLTGRRLRDT